MQNDNTYYVNGWDSHLKQDIEDKRKLRERIAQLENLLKSVKKVCPYCGRRLDEETNKSEVINLSST